MFKFIEFPDHHKYQEKEIKEIIDLAKFEKLSIVTTMKDFIRVPSQYKKYINIVDLEILIENESSFINFLLKKLSEI